MLVTFQLYSGNLSLFSPTVVLILRRSSCMHAAFSTFGAVIDFHLFLHSLKHNLSLTNSKQATWALWRPAFHYLKLADWQVQNRLDFPDASVPVWSRDQLSRSHLGSGMETDEETHSKTHVDSARRTEHAYRKSDRLGAWLIFTDSIPAVNGWQHCLKMETHFTIFNMPNNITLHGIVHFNLRTSMFQTALGHAAWLKQFWKGPWLQKMALTLWSKRRFALNLKWKFKTPKWNWDNPKLWSLCRKPFFLLRFNMHSS